MQEINIEMWLNITGQDDLRECVTVSNNFSEPNVIEASWFCEGDVRKAYFDPEALECVGTKC